MQGEHVGRRQRQADIVRGNLFSQPMDGIELRDHLLVGVVVTFWRQRPLAHVGNHERDIHAAFHHLGDVHLRGEAHGVVAFRREVGGLNIVMGIQFQNAAVNLFGFGDQCRVVRLGGAGAWCDLDEQADEGRCDAVYSLAEFQRDLLS